MTARVSPAPGERDRFLARLATGPLLADGAMGTLLYSRGIPQRANLDELVATRPEIIGAIHREYLEAGAELIETATFGANRIRLAAHGLADRAGALNRRGAQLAREARDVVGRDAWVGGSDRAAGRADPRAAAARRAGRPGGRPRAARRAARGRGRPVRVRDLLAPRALSWSPSTRPAGPPSLPIVAQLTFGEELQLPDGTTPAMAAAGARRGRGGRDRRQLRRRARGLRRGARGDGGRPTRPVRVDRRQPVALDHAQRRACRSGSRGSSSTPPAPSTSPGWCPRFLAAGGTVLGGCCGTTPAAHRGDAPGPGRGSRSQADRRGRRVGRRRAGHAPSRSRPPRVEAAARGAPPPTRSRPGPGRPPVRDLGRDRSARARSASSARSRRRACSRPPASTSSTSAIRRWPGSGWARWPWRSGSSTTSTSSASSTSRRATGT